MKIILVSACIIVLILSGVFIIHTFNNKNPYPDPNPSTQIPAFEDRTLSAEVRMEFIRNTTTDFLGVVVFVGRAIEFIHGDEEALPFRNENSERLETDYYFEITNWLFGEPTDEIIWVRSEIGHVFEIGKEYTFSAIPVRNHYNVIGNSWLLNNARISEFELEAFHYSFQHLPIDSLDRTDVAKKAEPTIAFIESIDVAILAKVTRIIERELDNGNFDALLELIEVVYGELNQDILDEFIILRGEMVVGEDYLILFRYDIHGNLTLAARKGAVIPYDSDEFHQFYEIIKLVSEDES